MLPTHTLGTRKEARKLSGEALGVGHVSMIGVFGDACPIWPWKVFYFFAEDEIFGLVYTKDLLPTEIQSNYQDDYLTFLNLIFYCVMLGIESRALCMLSQVSVPSVGNWKLYMPGNG